jgi:peptidoglycan-N-acetylglucosamine deacetylase
MRLAAGLATCLLLTLLHPVLGVAATVLFLFMATTQPGLRIYGPAVTRVSQGVVLTFDDGPHPDSTLPLLEALREADAKATFFVLVDRAEQHPDLMRAIAAEQEVGLHGLGHHPWLTLWSPKRGAEELKEAVRRLQAITGQPVRWYRPPFGMTSPRLAAAVKLAGLTTVWCSLRTNDGVLGGDERLVRACEGTKEGDIVLMHEGARSAPRVLPQILERMQARGLSLKSYGETAG